MRGFLTVAAITWVPLLGCSPDATVPTGSVLAEGVQRVQASPSDLYYSTASGNNVEHNHDLLKLGSQAVLYVMSPGESWIGLRGDNLVIMRDRQLHVVERGELKPLPLPPMNWVDHLGTEWVYYASDEAHEAYGDAVLMRARWTGGEGEVVASFASLREDPSSSHAVWIDSVEDDHFIYYVENVRYVHRLSKADNAPSLLLDIATILPSGRLPQPAAIALDQDSVYLTLFNQRGAGEGAVVKIDKAGGVATVLATDPQVPSGLAVDDTHVYWTRLAETGKGVVVRSRKDGTELQVLAENQSGPVDVAVVDTNVFWRNSTTDELRGITIPE